MLNPSSFPIFTFFWNHHFLCSKESKTYVLSIHNPRRTAHSSTHSWTLHFFSFIHHFCFGHAKFVQVLAREPHKKEWLDFSPAIELMGSSGIVSDRVPYTVQDNSRRAYLQKEWLLRSGEATSIMPVTTPRTGRKSGTDPGTCQKRTVHSRPPREK